MQWWDAIQTAWERLRVHPLQTGLSLMAIAVGILAIVGVSAFVAGVDQVVRSVFSLFGPRAIVVSRIGTGFLTEEEWEKIQRRPYLTEREAMAIRLHASEVESVGFIAGVQVPPILVVVSNGREETTPMLLRGVDELYLHLLQVDLAEGRGFTRHEVRAGRRVVIIGQRTVQALFPNRSPLGQTVYLDGIPFRVVGVLPQMPELQLGGPGPNSLILIPYTTLRRYYPDWEETLAISALARSERTVWRAVDQIVAILRWIHQLKPGEPNDFEVLTQRSLMEFWQQIQTGIQMALLMVSSVALLVGGIGITAVMVVAVTERTREIGLRKALGARRRDIALQFLLETLSLTLLGGAVGIVISTGLLVLLQHITPLPIALTPTPFLLGFGMASLTGLVAGLYPALRASRLDPVEALRYE